jgi:hypothetical protein
MHRGNGSAAAIGHEKRRAIRGPHRKQDPGIVGQQHVAPSARFYRIGRRRTSAGTELEFLAAPSDDLITVGGVDLLQLGKQKVLCPEGTKKCLAIFSGGTATAGVG